MNKLINGIEVPLSAAEIVEFNEREVAHGLFVIARASVKYQEDRKQEYPTIEALVVALLEDREGRPQALNDAMALRLAVRTKYPKPL